MVPYLKRLRELVAGKKKYRQYAEVFDAPEVSREGKSLVLGFGAGRCGQRWLSDIFDQHENCCSHPEPFSEQESFFRYVTWHKLAIDMGGFHALMLAAANWDWNRADISAFFSPFYSFGVAELVERLQPTHLFFNIRKPEDCVNSLYVKGWYAGTFTPPAAGKISGPQPLHARGLHRNFSRITPSGEEWTQWQGLSRIGKIAWYYVTVNTAILKALDEIGSVKKVIMKLSDIDQNYDYYQYLADYMQLRPVLSHERFACLKGQASNVQKRKHRVQDWSSQEKREFEEIVGPFYATYDSLQTTGI